MVGLDHYNLLVLDCLDYMILRVPFYGLRFPSSHLLFPDTSLRTSRPSNYCCKCVLLTVGCQSSHDLAYRFQDWKQNPHPKFKEEHLQLGSLTIRFFYFPAFYY
jgi:hypothetical protein